MSRISPLFALLAIGSVNGGTNASEIQPILDGDLAADNEFPEAVSLKNPWSSYHMCGGAIIGPRHVLTAGHCVDIIGANNIIVRAGNNDIRDQPHVVERSVVKIFIHPDYIPKIIGEQEAQNDIAILVVNRDLLNRYTVRALHLPTSPPAKNNQYTLAGWGRDGPTTRTYKLKVLGMILGDANICQSYLPRTICAYSFSGSPCPDDSGSPLTNGKVLYGILSTAECKLGTTAGFADVYYFLDWINTIIRQNPC